MGKNESNSYYDGNPIKLALIKALATIIKVLSLGICYPWAKCMEEKYLVEHRVIDGKRLTFDGTGTQLFFIYIKWFPLLLITAFLFSAFTNGQIRKWIAKHTHFVGSQNSTKAISEKTVRCD